MSVISYFLCPAHISRVSVSNFKKKKKNAARDDPTVIAVYYGQLELLNNTIMYNNVTKSTVIYTIGSSVVLNGNVFSENGGGDCRFGLLHNVLGTLCPVHRSSYILCPVHRSSYILCPAHRSSYILCPAHRSSYILCPVHRSSYILCQPYSQI